MQLNETVLYVLYVVCHVQSWEKESLNASVCTSFLMNISPLCFYSLFILNQEAYSVARQFNLIPPVCEQAEYHFFQRDKVETQLPELYHKIGKSITRFCSSQASLNTFRAVIDFVSCCSMVQS